MIRSFRDKETEAIFQQQRTRRFAQVADTALRRLVQINSAGALLDIASPPANRLEALKGARKGQYSVRVSDQYRICFRWKDGDAFDVEIVDYH